MHESILRRYITSLIGPFLSIVTFLAAYYLDPLSFSGGDQLDAIPAILFSITILVVSQFIVTDFEVKKTADYSGIIYEAIKDNLHITRVGSPEKALEYITHRMPSLSEVRNTSFNIEVFNERANEKCYDTVAYKEFIASIPIQASKNLIWKDLGDRFSIDVFRNISAELSQEEVSSERYKYRLLAHNEPQLNFAILEYKDGAKEVLFNWDFRGIGNDPIVLVSRDYQVLQMFTVHYTHLWNSASIDHDSIATKSIARKYEGSDDS